MCAAICVGTSFVCVCHKVEVCVTKLGLKELCVCVCVRLRVSCVSERVVCVCMCNNVCGKELCERSRAGEPAGRRECTTNTKNPTERLGETGCHVTWMSLASLPKSKT